MNSPTPRDAEYPAFAAEAAALILTMEKLEEAKELHAEYRAADKCDHSTPAERRKHMRTLSAWGEAQAWACDNFTAALDWKSGKQFSPMQLAEGRTVPKRADDKWWHGGEHRPSILAWDHAEFYRIGRAPAAIIVHVYADTYAECTVFATAHNLHFEPLPWSWYYPGGCIAGVYTRKVGI